MREQFFSLIFGVEAGAPVLASINNDAAIMPSERDERTMANTPTQIKIMQALREAPGPCSMYTLQEVTGASESALYRGLRELIADGNIQKWRIDGEETGYGFAEYAKVVCPSASDYPSEHDRV